MDNLANQKLFCRILSPSDITDEQCLSLSEEVAAVDWQALIDIANTNYLVPALCAALKRRDLLRHAEKLAQDYMEELHQFNFRRDESIRRQLSEIALTLNKIGITPIFLKGAAALADRWPDDSAARFMFDVDILVGEERAGEAYVSLEDIGYFAVRNKEVFRSPLAHHLAPLQKQGEPVLVELHKKPLSTRCGDIVSTSKVFREAVDVTDKHLDSINGRFKIPSPTHQALMSIVHTEVSHQNHLIKRLHIRHCSDLAWLSRRYATCIDWLLLREEMVAYGLGDVLQAHLYLQQEFFNLTTPVTVRKVSKYALRHYEKICRHIAKPRYKERAMRLIFTKIAATFSRETLSIKYGGQGFLFIQIARLKQLIFLVQKYCRADAWRSLLAGIKKVVGISQ